MLRTLLDRHRELRAEAERIARETLVDIRPDEIATRVERAVLGVDADRLAERSGRKRWGYVEASEAAWALLEEAVAPSFSDMNRLIVLGLEEPAVATCAGVVLGLYRVRDYGGDGVLAHASDFPAEMAGHFVATLARESVKKRKRRWTLPEDLLEEVPDWRAMLLRSGHGQ